ncbi:50S ribosomal protein L1 [Patescibacteria group bacterium]|nr:50S ribosomal protein L1 [Patescibacteria group bacterium]MBU1970221.1 50S ribosomal protein L1 [Patescibacteria group bacterium]
MTITQALETVKKTDKANFDSTIEVHINCALDKNKQETVRFNLTLPHGTGKTKKVAVLAASKVPGADLELTEGSIEDLNQGKLKPKVDFDLLLAEPRFMPKLAKAAKVLGRAGVMPNPKNGTVTEDVAKAVEQFKKGRLEVRTEPNGCVIHTIIGKRSFSTPSLEENFLELLAAVKAAKPAKAPENWIKSVFLAATMSPAVQVDL